MAKISENPCRPSENASCTPSPAEKAGTRNSGMRRSGATPGRGRGVSTNPTDRNAATRAARAVTAILDQAERQECSDAGRDHHEDPRGPALAATLEQRIHHRHERG